MLIRDVAVGEVEILHGGVEEVAQLSTSDCSSLQENSPQGILQVRWQWLNLCGGRTPFVMSNFVSGCE